MKNPNPKNSWKRALLAAAIMGPMVALQAVVSRLGVLALCQNTETILSIVVCKAAYFNGAVFMICFGLYGYGLFGGNRKGDEK